MYSLLEELVSYIIKYMNTDGIISNIVFPTLEKMELLKFLKFVEENDLYSDRRFIEYFKDRGFWFWSNVVCHTNLNMEKLFEEYEEYLNDYELVEHLIGRKERSDERIKENIDRYLKEYARRFLNEAKKIR